MNENVLVCVVDDDERVRNALSRLLKSAGYQASTYASAQALLAQPLPSDGTLTVVLTDLRMPGIDGIALAEQLSGAPIPPPVVFLSAHGDVPATVRAMKDGAVDFLEKPVREDDLFDALGRAVARSREQILRREALRDLRDRYEKLTPRERQVFALVVSGLINKEAAWELGISEKTIKVHRARVVEKMGARSLPDLVRMAGRLGIDVQPEGPPVQARAG
ncbi:MAG TPA: response regulator [Myxococcales bacterium]|nr:response regulator [Myxococcales bacterium]